MKRCPKCGHWKARDDFQATKLTKDGLSSHCKACRKIYAQQYRKEKRAVRAAYLEENKKHISLQQKKYREENKERIAAQDKAWYEQNIEKVSAAGKRRYESNKAESIRQKSEYRRKRLKSDPAFRVRVNLSTRLGNLLRTLGGAKAESTMALVGCSRSELMLHLQGQFKQGMSWNNYGPVWHVDHIKPCALFNLLEVADQKACFHWSNLQPLLAQENLKKRARYTAC
jgi:hypothetical protein